MTTDRSQCQWCGVWLFPIAGYSAAEQRVWHEAHCDLSLPCAYCGASPGVRCTTVRGKTTRHQSRRSVLSGGSNPFSEWRADAH